MTREEFVKQRQKDWARFEALLSFAEGGRSSGPRRFRLFSLFSWVGSTKLTPSWNGEDVSEFSQLFRAICYDLSLARTRDFGLALNRYLNNLVSRGHSIFYRDQPGSFSKVLRFFLEEFPWLLRKHIGYFWVALALFVLPGLVAGILLANNPELGSRLFSEETLDQYEMMHSPDRVNTRTAGDDVMMASFYIYNNVGIAFKCFASGAFFGVGTIYTLLFNSLYLGGVTGYMIAVGNATTFFTFAVSHGSFELTAIVVAGAGGLIIGRAIVHPGNLTRTESLKTRGLIGVKIALGAGGMLTIAAIIEGFWSPSPAPGVVKYIVGTFLWLLVIVYLAFAGRDYDPTAGIEEV